MAVISDPITHSWICRVTNSSGGGGEDPGVDAKGPRPENGLVDPTVFLSPSGVASGVSGLGALRPVT